MSIQLLPAERCTDIQVRQAALILAVQNLYRWRQTSNDVLKVAKKFEKYLTDGTIPE